MFRSLAIILMDVAIVATAFHYRIEDGVAPALLVFASTAATISFMLEAPKFFSLLREKAVAIRRTK